LGARNTTHPLPLKRRIRKNPWERREYVSLWLQERDKRILASLHEYGALTTEQISHLFFNGSISRATKRLRQLYDARFLQRAFRIKGRGAPEAIHFLERRLEVMEIVSEVLGKEVKEVRRFWFSQKQLTEHFLEINAFRVQVELSCREQGVDIEIWLDERKCIDQYRLEGKRKVITFSPDAYFRLLKEGVIWAYFLEWDRGTEELRRIREKGERYKEYWESGLYWERYGLKRFRVIWVVPGEERLRKISEALSPIHGAPPFWLAVREEVEKAGRNVLIEPVWKTLDGNKRALLS